MDRGISILKRFEREIAQINRAIEEIIEGDLGRSSQLLGYAALSEGKRIRPLLFLMSCRALGKDSEEIYIQSTAYELIHVASLLHDDVLDNAELRRNRPTVNAVWGNHLAVLGGDNL
ncbi:MAG: polyprenyl synthetase family protein, partial [Desulfatiglandales bacterium]